MFGKMVGNTRQGWVLWAASAIILLIARGGGHLPAEQTGNPHPDQRRGEPAGQRDAGGRQYGGQGGALRHHRLGACWP